MSTGLDKRLKTKCKEVNAAHRTNLWHSVLMCVLEAVNPITSFISQIWHPLRHQGENGLPSLQRKCSSQVLFGTYPSPTLPFHLHPWTRSAETLNNSSIFHPNPKDKPTQARSETTQQDWWKTSASPQFSPLPSSPVEHSQLFHGFMTCGRWSFVMKDLWAQLSDPAAVASLVPSHQVPWQQEAQGHAAVPILNKVYLYTSPIMW